MHHIGSEFVGTWIKKKENNNESLGAKSTETTASSNGYMRVYETMYI